ncbi:MAG: glycosyltransferase [Phormidesmis sp.]
MAKMLKRQPCHLIFAGAGEPIYVESLRQLSAKLNIKDHVTFTDFVSGYDKDLLLQGSDVFALPSHSENFGIAVAEALASGLPVVITPGVQISSEIQVANAGLIAEADADLFSNALCQVIGQPVLRSQMRENGLRLASSRYSWSTIAQEILAAYENVLFKNAYSKKKVSFI